MVRLYVVFIVLERENADWLDFLTDLTPRKTVLPTRLNSYRPGYPTDWQTGLPDRLEFLTNWTYLDTGLLDRLNFLTDCGLPDKTGLSNRLDFLTPIDWTTQQTGLLTRIHERLDSLIDLFLVPIQRRLLPSPPWLVNSWEGSMTGQLMAWWWSDQDAAAYWLSPLYFLSQGPGEAGNKVK